MERLRSYSILINLTLLNVSFASVWFSFEVFTLEIFVWKFAYNKKFCCSPSVLLVFLIQTVVTQYDAALYYWEGPGTPDDGIT